MASVAHVPRCPVDLLGPIFEHLKKDSLCVVSLASNVFRDEAQRVLFRKVPALFEYESHVKFLRTVAASPTRLALLVHKYKHSWIFGNTDDDKVLKSLSDVVAAGLKAMRRLKQLEVRLHFMGSSIPHAYIQVLSTCTFELERFDWKVDDEYINELVERFLPHQPTLRHLGLTCKTPLKNPLRLVTSTTCPQLVSLTASLVMIKAFLPGRKISTLSFSPGSGGITEGRIKRLAVELKNVKALSIPFNILLETEKPSRGILQYFSSLNVLHIYSIDYEDDYLGDTYIPLEAPELCNILSKTPILQKLILTDTPIPQSLDKDIEFMCHVFSKFGHHLKYIDVQTSFTSIYARYSQFQGTVQKIREWEALKLWSTTS